VSKMNTVELDTATGKVKFNKIKREDYLNKVLELTLNAKNYLDNLVKMDTDYPTDELPEFLKSGMKLINNFEAQDDYWLDQKCNYVTYFSPIYNAVTPDIPKIGKFSFKTGEIMKPSFTQGQYKCIQICKTVLLANADALQRAYDKNFEYYLGENGIPLAMEKESAEQMLKTDDKPSNSHTYV